MQAIFGCKDGTVLPVRLWLPLAVFGILLAPAKLVYLPLAALFLLIPNSRFGQSAATKKAAYLAGCVLLALSINRAVLVTSVAVLPGLKIRLPSGSHLRTGFYPGSPRFLIQQQRQLTIVPACRPCRG